MLFLRNLWKTYQLVKLNNGIVEGTKTVSKNVIERARPVDKFIEPISENRSILSQDKMASEALTKNERSGLIIRDRRLSQGINEFQRPVNNFNWNSGFKSWDWRTIIGPGLKLGISGIFSTFVYSLYYFRGNIMNGIENLLGIEREKNISTKIYDGINNLIPRGWGSNKQSEQVTIEDLARSHQQFMKECGTEIKTIKDTMVTNDHLTTEIAKMKYELATTVSNAHYNTGINWSALIGGTIASVIIGQLTSYAMSRLSYNFWGTSVETKMTHERIEACSAETNSKIETLGLNNATRFQYYDGQFDTIQKNQGDLSDQIAQGFTALGNMAVGVGAAAVGIEIPVNNEIGVHMVQTPELNLVGMGSDQKQTSGFSLSGSAKRTLGLGLAAASIGKLIFGSKESSLTKSFWKKKDIEEEKLDFLVAKTAKVDYILPPDSLQKAQQILKCDPKLLVSKEIERVSSDWNLVRNLNTSLVLPQSDFSIKIKERIAKYDNVHDRIANTSNTSIYQMMKNSAKNNLEFQNILKNEQSVSKFTRDELYISQGFIWNVINKVLDNPLIASLTGTTAVATLTPVGKALVPYAEKSVKALVSGASNSLTRWNKPKDASTASEFANEVHPEGYYDASDSLLMALWEVMVNIIKVVKGPK